MTSPVIAWKGHIHTDYPGNLHPVVLFPGDTPANVVTYVYDKDSGEYSQPGAEWMEYMDREKAMAQAIKQLRARERALQRKLDLIK